MRGSEQFLGKTPMHPCRRKLVDWINPTGVKKVHSSIDKVFNLVELINSFFGRKLHPGKPSQGVTQFSSLPDSSQRVTARRHP